VELVGAASLGVSTRCFGQPIERRSLSRARAAGGDVALEALLLRAAEAAVA
jgi:hypothetical protein